MKGENRVVSMGRREIAGIAASFQAAVIDVLVKQTKWAAKQIKAKTVLMGWAGWPVTARCAQHREVMCKKGTLGVDDCAEEILYR